MAKIRAHSRDRQDHQANREFTAASYQVDGRATGMTDRPIKILLINENAIDARFLCHSLAETRSTQFDPVTATGVDEALRRLNEDEFDLILLCLASEGDEVLDTFTHVHSRVPELPIIVLTDFYDDGIAVKIVRAGAQDCLVKGTFSNRLLAQAIRFALARSQRLKALRDAQQLLQSRLDAISKAFKGKSVRLDELQNDLNIAASIQARLLPQKVAAIEGFDISAYYRPCEEVGGDYYDFIQISPERLGLVVADVSGKGVPGLVVMTMFRSLLRTQAAKSYSAKKPLTAANKLIADDVRPGMFVTCCYIVLNHSTAAIHVCNAGHNPLICWRQKTGKSHVISPQGAAIGLDRGPVFDRLIQEQHLQLEAGDRILAYSDGLVEAMNPKRELFGESQLLDLTAAHAHESSDKFVKSLVEAVEKHRKGAPQNDDVTILTLRYLGIDASACHS